MHSTIFMNIVIIALVDPRIRYATLFLKRVVCRGFLCELQVQSFPIIFFGEKTRIRLSVDMELRTPV